MRRYARLGNGAHAAPLKTPSQFGKEFGRYSEAIGKHARRARVLESNELGAARHRPQDMAMLNALWMLMLLLFAMSAFVFVGVLIYLIVDFVRWQELSRRL
jgi:hypothetical protein